MVTAKAVAPRVDRRIDTAAFRMALDASGIIHVIALGFWDVDTVDRYFESLDGLLVEARARFGIARVLVDKRTAPVQSAKTAERIQAGCLTFYAPTDRLAVIVASTLVKLQVKRELPADRADAFLTVAEAEHFLRG